MRFPDRLTIIARDRNTGLPVKNIAIILVLFATHKNDYYVGPLIANENGEVEFTRAECEVAIKRAQEMFIMDYSGNLESCRPIIEVRLHSPKQIETMLQNYNQSPDFWGRAFPDPSRLFEDLRKVRNAEYEQSSIKATEEQLLSNARIELPVDKKTAR